MSPPYQEADVAAGRREDPGEVGVALQDEDVVARCRLGTAHGQVHLREGRAARARDPLQPQPLTPPGPESPRDPDPFPRFPKLCPPPRGGTRTVPVLGLQLDDVGSPGAVGAAAGAAPHPLGEHLGIEVRRGVEVLLGDAVWGAAGIWGGSQAELGSPKPNRARWAQRGCPGEPPPRGPGVCWEQGEPCSPFLPTLVPPGVSPLPATPCPPRTFAQAEVDGARVPQLAVGRDAPVGAPCPVQQLPLAGSRRQLPLLHLGAALDHEGVLRARGNVSRGRTHGSLPGSVCSQENTLPARRALL